MSGQQVSQSGFAQAIPKYHIGALELPSSVFGISDFIFRKNVSVLTNVRHFPVLMHPSLATPYGKVISTCTATKHLFSFINRPSK
jgi:hypothetical protein